jgi:endonuclease/exonuclease/phosphatase family metal-dependent hydrolase
VGVRPSPTSKPVTQEEFDAKIAFLSTAIAEREPDIIALQEIGGSNAADESCLAALQAALGGDYPNRAVGTPDNRRIKVAFLSKLALLNPDNGISDFPEGPFDSVPNHTGFDPFTAMSRGALKVEVEPVNGVRVRLITVHLKSKLLSFPRHGAEPTFSTNDENLRAEAGGIALGRRTAEAVTVRTFLNGVMPSDQAVHTITLGDFNDDPKAATSLIFLGPEDKDITTGDSKDPVRLYNLMESVPLPDTGETGRREFLREGERFTRLYEGRGEILDQILASRSLIFRNGNFHVNEVRSFVQLIKGQSVTDNPNERAGKAASDHAPVLAVFDV